MQHSRKDLPADFPSPHALRPRLWRPESQDAPARPAPLISVLVPVRNEGQFITATLRQVLDQHYDPERFEVIVADGQSTDDTRDRVVELQAEYGNLHLIHNPGRWSSAGRNAALEASRGDVIVIVDGHCEIDNKYYLADLADAFTRTGAACVGRPQPLDVTQASALQRAVAACRSSRLGHHPASFIYSSEERYVKASSVAVAYRREVFDLFGPFDESFDACEDVEFNHRLDAAGLRCWFTPRVQVRYQPRGTLPGLFRQMVRYGRGRVRLARKHRETFSFPGFVPAFFTLGLLTGPLLGLVSFWLMAAYLGVVGLYLVLVLGTSLQLGIRQHDVRVACWAPLVFLAVHIGAGTGILLETLRRGRPPRRADVQPARLPIQERRHAA